MSVGSSSRAFISDFPRLVAAGVCICGWYLSNTYPDSPSIICQILKPSTQYSPEPPTGRRAFAFCPKSIPIGTSGLLSEPKGIDGNNVWTFSKSGLSSTEAMWGTSMHLILWLFPYRSFKVTTWCAYGTGQIVCSPALHIEVNLVSPLRPRFLATCVVIKEVLEPSLRSIVMLVWFSLKI